MRIVNIPAYAHLVESLAPPAIALAASLAATLLLRRLLLGWARRQSRRPDSRFARAFLETIRVPSLLWALAASIAITLQFAQLSPRHVDRAEEWIHAFVIMSLSVAASAIAIRMAATYGERENLPGASSGLLRAIIRVVFLSLGAVIALQALEYKLTGLLTALGVSGLAIALALQDTLSNFFAGIHILMEEPIRVGDWVRLSSGEEGQVHDIGWRTTRVLTGSNNIIVIPNTKITSGILINFSLPATRSSADIAIVAAHSADVDQVANLILEEVSATPGILPDPAPLVLFDPGVLPTHLQFKLIFHVARHTEAGPVQSAARARILARFRREGVPLPSLPLPLQ
jgi:small-conductance mechanosensitive channel